LCNMTTTVAAANTDSSPVLILSGEIPVDMEGLGEFQDASQATLDDTAVMKPLTRLSTTVASARNLNHWLRHGLTAMLAQPRGPVHLSLTHDTLMADCAAEYVPVSDFFTRVEPLSQQAAVHALDLLAGTKRIAPIPDALQAQAAAEWGKDGLVEIVVVSGFYQLFAAINQGFDIASLK
jgi:acetolactate synthase I/II/III large subunit